MLYTYYGKLLLLVVCSQGDAFIFATRPAQSITTRLPKHCNIRGMECSEKSICLKCERPGFYPLMYCNDIIKGDYCYTSIIRNASGIFTAKGPATSSFCDANKYKSSLANPSCRTGNIPEGTECIDCCKQYNCDPNDLYCNKHIIQSVHMPFTVTTVKTTPTVATTTVPTTTTTTTQPTPAHGSPTTTRTTTTTTTHGHVHHTHKHTHYGHHHSVTTTRSTTEATTTRAGTTTKTTNPTTTWGQVMCSGNMSVVCEDDPKTHCDSLKQYGLCTHLQYNPDSEDIKFCPRTCNLCNQYCDYVLRTVPPPTTIPPTTPPPPKYINLFPSLIVPHKLRKKVPRN